MRTPHYGRSLAAKHTSPRPHPYPPPPSQDVAAPAAPAAGKPAPGAVDIAVTKTSPLAKASAFDFEWDAAPEPHATRRAQILARYGDRVRALYGPDSFVVVKVALSLGVQLAIASVAAELPLWAFIAVAYTIGGVINHGLTLAMHEVSHNLAFRSFSANRAFGIVTNLALGIPSFACVGGEGGGGAVCGNGARWLFTSTHAPSRHSRTDPVGRCEDHGRVPQRSRRARPALR